jgi:ATP-binding cassette subfamily E protein 1
VNKYAKIDFDKCRAEGCDPEKGICRAASACKHKVLEQEEPFDSPMLLSMKLCVGCGDCVTVCPLSAIELKSGSY